MILGLVLIFNNVYAITCDETPVQHTLYADQSAIVNGKTVKLDNAGSTGSVIVTVDGVSGTISLGSSRVINGLEIRVVSSHYDDVRVNRYATLEFCPKETTTTQIISSTTIPVPTTSIVTTIPITTTTQRICETGCWYNDVCVPFGFRVSLDGIPSYCDIDKTFKTQKGLDESCMNNYECNSNECSNSKCVSTYNLLEKILDAIKNFFKFGKGKFIEVFGR
jgi:hypothetical protein